MTLGAVVYRLTTDPAFAEQFRRSPAEALADAQLGLAPGELEALQSVLTKLAQDKPTDALIAPQEQDWWLPTFTPLNSLASSSIK